MRPDQVALTVAGFAAALRAEGLAVGIDQVQCLVGALGHLDPTRRDQVYWASRATLLSRREEQPVFDRVFLQYWGGAGAEFVSDTSQKMPVAPRHNPNPRPALAALMAQRAGKDDPERDIRDRQHTASVTELLRRKDFGCLTEEEISALKRLSWARPLEFAQRQTRRTVHSVRRGRPDLRRAAAQAARTGAIPCPLPRRLRKSKPRPVVLLVDISGSMELYARVLLQFFHALGQRLPLVETFVFATRITRISRQLGLRDVDRALQEVSGRVQDFSGGTRIGDCVERYNQRWGGRTTRRGAVVLIVSDGCDTGPVDKLVGAMDELKKHCYRLIWLNPRLGHSQYRPEVRALRAVLPLVDDFMTCHNLQSLERLAQHLTQLPRLRGRTASDTAPWRFAPRKSAGVPS